MEINVEQRDRIQDTKGKSVQPKNEVFEKESYVPPSPYKPLISFPQRLVKPEIKHFRKFVEMLRKLYINIPFTEALSQMPSYAKFLKEVLLNKQTLEDTYTLVLNATLSSKISCLRN